MTIEPPPRTRTASGSALLTLAAFVIVVAGMQAAQPVIIPFLLSIFIAVISAPALFWLEEHGLPRMLAMLVVVGGIIATGLALSVVVGSSIKAFSKAIPTYKARLNDQLGQVLDYLRAKGLEFDKSDVLQFVEPGAAIQIAADLLNSFSGVLTNAFLIIMTVVFILLETSSFPEKLRSMTRNPENSMAKFGIFTANLRRYLAIKTLASMGTGICAGVWLWVLGVDYPVLWGILAFLLNYVPNIGSIIAAVPAILLALIQFGPGTALSAFAGYFVINFVFGNVLEPRFMGRGLGLSTLVVFLSLVFWGWVLGPVGMFLSVPLTMTAKIALDSREDTHWIAVMLGTATDARAGQTTPPRGDEGA